MYNHIQVINPHKHSNEHHWIDIYNQTHFSFYPSDICIITLPFSRKLTNPFDYTMAIQQLLPKKFSKIQTSFIYSSTSIYPNTEALVDETSLPDISERAQALHKTEQYLLNNSNECLILRLSGICGESRNSKKALKKSIIEHAKTPMNLIHINDIITVMNQLCSNEPISDIINVTCSEHNQRIILYLYQSIIFETTTLI